MACSLASVTVIALQLFFCSAASNSDLDTAAAQDQSATDQVSVTAGASFVRREGEKNATKPSHDKHRYEPHSIKAMFTSLDLDGDGLLTALELKKVAEMRHYQSPTLNALLEQALKNSRSTTFAEFHDAVQRAASHGGLHHMHKHALVHQHQGGNASWNVTCGGHKAPTCEACTTTDADGNTVSDHGSDWCNGDCVYNPAELKCCVKGTIIVSGTHTGITEQYSTSPIPDLLNPNITSKDKTVTDDAAGAAIREENRENAEKQRQEKLDAENNGSFWLVVVIAFSVVLAICAIASIVAAVVVFCVPRAGKGGGDGRSLADADGGDEASASG